MTPRGAGVKPYSHRVPPGLDLRHTYGTGPATANNTAGKNGPPPDFAGRGIMGAPSARRLLAGRGLP
jgi:hypothetical protein